MLNKNLIHSALQRNQYGDVPRTLLAEQIPIGLGGQISGRLLALKIGLAFDRKVVFRHDTDPPYVQSFVRQSDARADAYNWEATPLVDHHPEKWPPTVRFNYFSFRSVLESDDSSVEAWANKAILSKYNMPEQALVELDAHILNWFRLLPSVDEAISQERTRLGISSGTLGVHLRRGDKSVESAYVPSRYFNEAINTIFRMWKFNSVFLASDSPEAFREIQLPKDVRLIFDTEEKRYNNANHKMLRNIQALADEETFTAIKNFNLLASCGGIVGQDNAHFATLAASIISERMRDTRRACLIDGRIAERSSWPLRKYFILKRGAREFAKRILPPRITGAIGRFSSGGPQSRK